VRAAWGKCPHLLDYKAVLGKTSNLALLEREL